MKKILLSLLLTLAFVSLVSAAPFTAPTGFPTKSVIQATDTAFIITGADSITMFKNERIDPTALYFVQFADSIATGDSVIVSLRVYNESNVKTYIYQEDTLRLADAYMTTALPVNKTVFGMKMDIKALTLVATLVKRVRSCVLYKIIPITGWQPSFTR
jgi:hypothetical protein